MAAVAAVVVVVVALAEETELVTTQRRAAHRNPNMRPVAVRKHHLATTTVRVIRIQNGVTARKSIKFLINFFFISSVFLNF
jgi:hypothetical protein